MKKSSIYILITLSLFVNLFIACENEEEKENEPPTCNITNPGYNSKIQTGEQVTITVDAEDSDGSITEVNFYIDDSIISSIQSFPYYYNWETEGIETKSYSIEAKAIDNSGSEATDRISVNVVNENPPIADFEIIQETIFRDDTIQFIDKSLNNPTNWSWKFKYDNTSNYYTPGSSEQNPSHSYNAYTGLSTVTLIVKNDFGSDTIVKIIEVEMDVGTVSDIDGNVYKTVRFGNQWWMAENLKTTRFNDGSDITYAQNADDMFSLGNSSTSAFLYYDFNSGYKDTLGVLYNSHVVTSNKNVCPSGWHISTLDNFNLMHDLYDWDFFCYWENTGFDPVLSGMATLNTYLGGGYDAEFYGLWSAIHLYFVSYTEMGNVYGGYGNFSGEFSFNVSIYQYHSIRCVKD